MSIKILPNVVCAITFIDQRMLSVFPFSTCIYYEIETIRKKRQFYVTCTTQHSIFLFSSEQIKYKIHQFIMLEMFFHSIIVIHKTKRVCFGYNYSRSALSVHCPMYILFPLLYEPHTHTYTLSSRHVLKTHTRQINEIYKFIMQPNACFILCPMSTLLPLIVDRSRCSGTVNLLTKINMHGHRRSEIKYSVVVVVVVVVYGCGCGCAESEDMGPICDKSQMKQAKEIIKKKQEIVGP